MTEVSTAQHLRTIALRWSDLHEALGTPSTTSWPPSGLRAYLSTLEQADPTEALALRAQERNPDQIGATAAPIRLDILDTMRAVETVLIELADQVAAEVQRSPMRPAPRTWPPADRARRNELAHQDAADPRRWRYTGQRTAPRAAAWLLGRVQAAAGPFRPLNETQHQRIASIAAGAAERVERALDLAAQRRTVARPCACGGRIEIHGGAGAAPVAHCTGCGTVWTDQGQTS